MSDAPYRDRQIGGTRKVDAPDPKEPLYADLWCSCRRRRQRRWGALRRLRERGLDPDAADDQTSDKVLFATVTDPEGNTITLVEER